MSTTFVESLGLLTDVQSDLRKLFDVDEPSRICQLSRRDKGSDQWEDCENPAAWIVYVHFDCGHRPDQSVLACQECMEDILAESESPLINAILCTPDWAVCMVAAQIKRIEPL